MGRGQPTVVVPRFEAPGQQSCLRGDLSVSKLLGRERHLLVGFGQSVIEVGGLQQNADRVRMVADKIEHDAVVDRVFGVARIEIDRAPGVSRCPRGLPDLNQVAASETLRLRVTNTYVSQLGGGARSSAPFARIDEFGDLQAKLANPMSALFRSRSIPLFPRVNRVWIALPSRRPAMHVVELSFPTTAE